MAANGSFDPSGAVAVVTGAASGIGAALAEALHAAGAATVVLADIDRSATASVADGISSAGDAAGDLNAIALDVSDRAATAAAVEEVESRHGPIDLWCANAGVGTLGGVEATPEAWQHTWDVNVMAHVHAAAELVPRWTARGRGHLLVTASAAGLLTNLGDAPYSVTKHAAVAFAEWVAITHGADGVGVSCLCPQGVRTPMLFGSDMVGTLAAAAVTDQRILEPAEVAAAALDGLAEGCFLILPHQEVSGYEQARAADHDRWIAGMRRLQARLGP